MQARLAEMEEEKKQVSLRIEVASVGLCVAGLWRSGRFGVRNTETGWRRSGR